MGLEVSATYSSVSHRRPSVTPTLRTIRMCPSFATDSRTHGAVNLPVRSSFAVLVFVSLIGVAGSARGENGIVLDKSTKRPIPNAIVVAVWNGETTQFVQRQGECYKAEFTQSDGQGRFSVSGFSGNFNPMLWNRHRDVFALASGYRMAPSRDPSGLEVLMEPQTGTNSERIQRLPRFGPLACGNDSGDQAPYLKEFYREVADLATTPEEKTQASNILYMIEANELGEAEAARRLGARTVEIKKGAKQ